MTCGFVTWSLLQVTKPQQNLKVSASNYEPRGVPLEVSGRVNAQTSRFRQLDVRSDLSNYHEFRVNTQLGG